ncbi:MAG: MBL fold metallo-hydrolase [Planctomycetota bacterium]
MRVLPLGVGDAFTTRSFGTSAIVEGPEGYLLIDCPDLIHRAILEATSAVGWTIDSSDIDDIVLTHLHGDHCNGLESFAFKRVVQRLRGEASTLPRLHTHRAAADRVWERLAPAMDAPLNPGDPASTLDDYFELHRIEHGVPTTIAGLTIETRPTIHPIPTIGLRISDGTRTLGWSGDTAFDEAHLDWLSSADVIVHEANLGPAHTHIDLLNALPAQLRAKMRITHIYDEYDPASSDIPVLEPGVLIDL